MLIYTDNVPAVVGLYVGAWVRGSSWEYLIYRWMFPLSVSVRGDIFKRLSVIEPDFMYGHGQRETDIPRGLFTSTSEAQPHNSCTKFLSKLDTNTLKNTPIIVAVAVWNQLANFTLSTLFTKVMNST